MVVLEWVMRMNREKAVISRIMSLNSETRISPERLCEFYSIMDISWPYAVPV